VELERAISPTTFCAAEERVVRFVNFTPSEVPGGAEHGHILPSSRSLLACTSQKLYSHLHPPVFAACKPLCRLVKKSISNRSSVATESRFIDLAQPTDCPHLTAAGCMTLLGVCPGHASDVKNAISLIGGPNGNKNDGSLT